MQEKKNILTYEGLRKYEDVTHIESPSFLSSGGLLEPSETQEGKSRLWLYGFPIKVLYHDIFCMSRIILLFSRFHFEAAPWFYVYILFR